MKYLQSRFTSYFLLLACLFSFQCSFAQRKIIQQKNFPLFSFIQENDETGQMIAENEQLKSLTKEKIQRVYKQVSMDSMRGFLPIDSIVGGFLFSEIEVAETLMQFRKLSTEPLLKKLIAQMRESDQFYMDEQKNDAEFILSALKREMKGINQIISVYVLGGKTNYSNIDSVSYNVRSDYYQKVINITALNISDDLDTMKLFFEPSLSFALWLLEINERNEAARFEPMELGENARAVATVNKIDWDEYPYSVILVPGHGPEEEGVALSPLGMMRCKLAADRFKKKLAPFIILSGGYVHPFQTPFCEAIEMKKELMDRYGIPESALIIEPHARHTTTNFRNAARLIFKYQIPSDKKALCTTTVDQSYYITNMNFDKRCLTELGYLPYKLGNRLNRNDIEFYPLKSALFLDRKDPLDP